MTIHIPVTVRIHTSRRDSDITNQVNDDLTFRSAIPGGYASLSFTLNRPLDVTPDDIEYFAKVYVYDGRNGNTLWEGRLEDPGRGSGSNGEIWAVTAVGPSAHARDITAPVLYVDTTYDGWERSRFNTSSISTTTTSEVPGTDDLPALNIGFASGASVPVGQVADMVYRRALYAGQHLARVRFDFVSGVTTTTYSNQLVFRTGTGLPSLTVTRAFNTTSNLIAANLSDGIALTDNIVSVRTSRNTATATGTDVTNTFFSNVSVRAVLKNADGTDNNDTAGYTDNDIDCSEVVADLLGRVLPLYDGANATIETSTPNMTQLAYPDGATAADILDDLLVFDPSFYWAAWESNPDNGKYRFEFIPWPTGVRYEADTDEGFDSPGSAADLYNQVDVRWRLSDSKIYHVIRTQTVPELDAAGITRRAFIDLSSELGSAFNAQTAGDNFLKEHASPPNAGTLTISKPIMDNGTGRMTYPWELVPGHLIRVRGVNPRQDALNPSDRDGITIFRIVSTEYNVGTGQATLELDTYSRTVARALANLSTNRVRKL